MRPTPSLCPKSPHEYSLSPVHSSVRQEVSSETLLHRSCTPLLNRNSTRLNRRRSVSGRMRSLSEQSTLPNIPTSLKLLYSMPHSTNQHLQSTASLHAHRQLKPSRKRPCAGLISVQFKPLTPSSSQPLSALKTLPTIILAHNSTESETRHCAKTLDHGIHNKYWPKKSFKTITKRKPCTDDQQRSKITAKRSCSPRL